MKRHAPHRASCHRLLAGAASLAACLACGAPPAAQAGLPIAALSCPAAVEPGHPFEVDGSASSDDEGDFSEVSLSVGAESVAALSGTFTVAEAGTATAFLSVTDHSGHVAEAHCRIVVGGGAALPPGDDGDISDLDLTGGFALIAYDRAQLSGGALAPSPQCAPAPSLAMVELQQAIGELTMTMRWCTLEMPDVEVTAFGIFDAGLQDGEIPASTTALLPALGPATFSFDGTSFAPPLEVFGRAMVAGATLADPDHDPLPVGDGVTDDDGDGTPGVPIFVNDSQVNVVLRRALRALSGAVRSSDEIDGAAQGSFNADTEVGLQDGTGLMQSQSPSGIALPSTFRMVRVDGANGGDDLRGADGVLSCTDLEQRAAALLASVPTPAAPDGCHVPPQS